MERQWLLYFSEHSGPAIANLADQELWSVTLPQLGFTDATVRHALLAVASAYARFQAGGTLNREPILVSPEFSVRHYNSAISGLRRTLVRDPSSTEIALVCCLLFICLECLHGNGDLMLVHLRNGLNIVKSARVPPAASQLSCRKTLTQVFDRLEAHSTLEGQSLSSELDDFETIPSATATFHFDGIADAQRSLSLLITLALRFIKSASDQFFAGMPRPESSYLLQKRLQDRLLAWRTSLDDFQSSIPSLSLEQLHILTSFRIENSATFVYLSTCFEVEETSFDAYRPEFANIVEWAESLDRARSITTSTTTSTTTSRIPSFTLYMSLIPSLALTAMKCRDPTLRRRAIYLLKNHCGREGLWNATVNAAIALRIVEIEEHGLELASQRSIVTPEELTTSSRLSPDIVPTSWPPAHARVFNTKTSWHAEPSPRLVRVTFYKAPFGLERPWTVWEEDVPL